MEIDGSERLQSQPSAPDANATTPGRRGLRTWTLLLIYVAAVLAPFALASQYYPIAPHAPIDIAASALGITAFAALMVEFLFSGRTHWISSRIGATRTMQIHRRVAYGIIACIVVHPFLYTAPDNIAWPWFNAVDATLILNNWSLFSGLLAWVLTATIILIAVDHNKLPGSYQTWRNLHAISAMVIGVLIAVHAITAGGYSSQPVLVAYWMILLGAGVWTLIEMFTARR